MSEKKKNEIGTIAWRDLTVKDAKKIKDFYCKVMGWKAEPHDMGDYHDFDIKSPYNNETVTGICYARDTNANIPFQWLMYVNVEDVDESAEICVKNGGKVVDGPRMMGQVKFCVIQDPEGAVIALISQ